MKIFKLEGTERAEELFELENRIFPAHHYSLNQILEMLKNDRYSFIVAERDNKIIGYLIVLDSCDILEIVKIAVNPQEVGRGTAENILNHALYSTKLDLILEVRESNKRAIFFYKKMGFQEISIRKNYYSDNGENAVIMLLNRS